MKTNKPLLLITVLFLFGIKTILACDCRSRGTISEEFQNTTAVFSGKVIAREYQKITDAADKDFELEVLFVKIKADRWWKGNGDSEVEMRTASARMNGATRRNSCDYSFKEEESYLVFANFYGGWFKTTDCSRTRVLSNADEELKYLGEGFQPNDAFSVLKTSPEFFISYPAFSRLD